VAIGIERDKKRKISVAGRGNINRKNNSGLSFDFGGLSSSGKGSARYGTALEGKVIL
jgi:hypothetical protein